MSIYTLNDVPSDFDVELSEGLVNALDKMNRPWLYNGSGKKRGTCQLWAASDPFFKRLWGWSRYRTSDNRGAYKDGDNGAFINYSDIPQISLFTNCPWWLLEDNIIAIRNTGRGKALQTRLPIKPDKWWAKLFGFYWSSGVIWYRDRNNWREYVFRLAVDDQVIPMVRETGRHIGDDVYESTYIPVYDGEHKAEDLRAGVRQNVFLSTATLFVANKFGLPMPELDHEEFNKANMSRNFNPVIPQWVLSSDENMHGFIEGYVNGQRGHSIMTVSSNGKGVATQVLIRFRGFPAEDAEIFGEQISQWLAERGVKGYFRETRRSVNPPDKSNRAPEFEYVIFNREYLTRFWEMFEIRRPDMRARLLLVEALGKHSVNEWYEDAVEFAIHKAIMSLNNSVSIVIFGVLYEKPRSFEELRGVLRIYPEQLKILIDDMIDKKIVKETDEEYHIDLSKFSKALARKYNLQLEEVQERISDISISLTYQCENCGLVFIKGREECSSCGGKVYPVERRKVLKPIVAKSNHLKRKIRITGGKQWEKK